MPLSFQTPSKTLDQDLLLLLLLLVVLQQKHHRTTTSFRSSIRWLSSFLSPSELLLRSNRWFWTPEANSHGYSATARPPNHAHHLLPWHRLTLLSLPPSLFCLALTLFANPGFPISPSRPLVTKTASATTPTSMPTVLSLRAISSEKNLPFLVPSTPPLTLGCAKDTSDTKGILGMNLGRLSFASQAKITKFSYCVPNRPAQTGSNMPTGSFYLGHNPSSAGFQYVDLLTFSQSQRMPNLDPLAYTVVMVGIRVGGKMLKIQPSVFRPDASGAGQTMIDSGSEFTYFVDEAYSKVREEIVRLAGPKLKKGYMYAGVSDMCFDGDGVEIGRLIGDMAFVFDKGVEIVTPKEQILADVGGGVRCVAIGQSNMLGAASNIIGNFHQRNQWVEFDLANRRVGFGRADCSRS